MTTLETKKKKRLKNCLNWGLYSRLATLPTTGISFRVSSSCLSSVNYRRLARKGLLLLTSRKYLCFQSNIRAKPIRALFSIAKVFVVAIRESTQDRFAAKPFFPRFSQSEILTRGSWTISLIWWALSLAQRTQRTQKRFRSFLPSVAIYSKEAHNSLQLFFLRPSREMTEINSKLFFPPLRIFVRFASSNKVDIASMIMTLKRDFYNRSRIWANTFKICFPFFPFPKRSWPI